MDRLFDRELSSTEREQLSRELESDPDALRRFRETTDILLALREPAGSCDVTDAVLDRLRRQNRPAVRHRRRVITMPRVAVAAAIFGAIAGVAIMQNFAPTPAASDRSHAPTDADELVARMTDPARTQAELSAINRAAARKPGDDLLAIESARTLRSSPLRFDLTQIDIWGGASDLSQQPGSSLLAANPWLIDPSVGSNAETDWSLVVLDIDLPDLRPVELDSGSDASPSLYPWMMALPEQYPQLIPGTIGFDLDAPGTSSEVETDLP